MTWLLDSNVLVALAIDTHEFHARASRWFAREKGHFATCAVTQGALLRLHMTLAKDRTAEAAWASLGGFVAHPRHEFWAAGFGYTELVDPVIQGADVLLERIFHRPFFGFGLELANKTQRLSLAKLHPVDINQAIAQ